MTERILISIGGTGAKIFESLLPCLTAGLGPSEMSVAFVDQDESNGNVTRARQRLANYRAFRQVWNQGDNRLVWSGADATPLAATEIPSILGGADLWCPHPDRTTTLSTILERDLLDGEHGKLMDMLFHPDEREQKMKLGEGYRGQPHIGAAAMVSESLNGGEFWAKIEEKIRNVKAGEDVRIFLAGSVFGGTGAAGFPTIARMIRKRCRDIGVDVHLGGLLMLPYFTFVPPKPGEPAAKPEDLLIQSQGALGYYARLLQSENIFNQLFLLGWNKSFQLGYGSPGADKQMNPPLPPELIGALACLKFFEDNVPPQADNPIYILSRLRDDQLEWSDLPAITATDAGKSRAQLALGRLLRFCVVWRNTIQPELRRRINPLGWPAWARKQGANRVTYNTEQQETVEKLAQLIADTLTWASSMSGFAVQGGLKVFDLWDTSRLCTFDKNAPTDPVQLKAPMQDDLTADAFALAVRGLDEAQKPRPQGKLIEEISETPMPGDYHGLGRLVAAVFRGARLFDAQSA